MPDPLMSGSKEDINPLLSFIDLLLLKPSTEFDLLDDWLEYRDTLTGTMFYVNSEGRYGGGAWEKPMKFVRSERRQYGWEILNTMTDVEWKPIRRRSKLMRTIDPWDEYRDDETGGM